MDPIMPKSAPRILMVEDNQALAHLYREYLAGEPVSIDHVSTGAMALDALSTAPAPVTMLDLVLPDMNGFDILRQISAAKTETTVVVITAHGSVNVAVDAMRLGAFDFLVKPFSAERLIVTVRNALERQRLARIVETYRADFERNQYLGFIGSSLAMQAVYRIIDSAAPSKATVFVTGESGTGKELCAQAIHTRSPRAAAPFIAINCAAIPKDLIESEIFGHVKGAFTGATDNRDGAARQAHGGTLFLDEICEMDLGLQSKLLRFVQTGTFQRVGGSRTETVDVRFLCATNRDPLAEVRAGRFREDLYYRLHVIPLHLPPLRERDDDVLQIALSFLNQYAREEGKGFSGFTPEAEAALLRYYWPGNVRELQNAIRTVVVLHQGELVAREMLPPPLNGVVAEPRPVRVGEGGQRLVPADSDLATRIRPLEQVEREAIEQAISACGGSVVRAAQYLGVSPSTIYRKQASWQRSPDLV